MDFEADPYINVCRILDPDEKLWFHRPPPNGVQLLVPRQQQKRLQQEPPAYHKRHVESLGQFHDVMNDVLKKVVQELKFQNDVLRLFIFQCEGGGAVEFETAPFLKLVLILGSLGISETNDHSSQNYSFASRSGLELMTGVTRRVSARLLALMEDYEELKLRLESAWTLEEALSSHMSRRALVAFTNNLTTLGTTHRAAHLYWEVWKWLKRVTSETGEMGMKVERERSTASEWWLVARKLAGFEESLPCPPAQRYHHLLQMSRLMDVKRRAATATMDTVIPHLGILRYQAALFKTREREAKACKNYLMGQKCNMHNK